jgi:hypothetical protein
MRHARARARAQGQAKVQTLPESLDLTLWSIGTALSAAVLYLVWSI